MMEKRFSKRKFLKLIASFAAYGGVIQLANCFTRPAATNIDEMGTIPVQASSVEQLSKPVPTVSAQTASIQPAAAGTTQTTYLPLVSRQVPTLPSSSKVVHVHASGATNWNFSSTTWYGNYVSQNTVDTMMEEGIQQVTGQSSVSAAWQAILPNYTQGKAIAVKVNFNNSSDCANGGGYRIDALIEPVNALIKGLKSMGVAEQDIWIYDAIRPLPTRFISRCLYSGVKFYGYAMCGAIGEAFSSSSSDAVVTFNHPTVTNMPKIRIADALINASYLINMPIMKNHGDPGVSLTFKNHFGTIDHPFDLHNYILLNASTYNSSYSPLVDIYKNPNIRNKAVLTIGDGLFGAKNFDSAPVKWTTFGNSAPNSLFLSRDPVAIDCVMYDLLSSEMSLRSGADDYLRLAGNAGLGVFEHGNPWGSGYSKIIYQKINM